MILPWKRTAKKYRHLYLVSDALHMEFMNKAFEAGLTHKIIIEHQAVGDLYKGYELVNERAEKAEAEKAEAEHKKEFYFHEFQGMAADYKLQFERAEKAEAENLQLRAVLERARLILVSEIALAEKEPFAYQPGDIHNPDSAKTYNRGILAGMKSALRMIEPDEL